MCTGERYSRKAHKSIRTEKKLPVSNGDVRIPLGAEGGICERPFRLEIKAAFFFSDEALWKFQIDVCQVRNVRAFFRFGAPPNPMGPGFLPRRAFRPEIWLFKWSEGMLSFTSIGRKFKLANGKSDQFPGESPNRLLSFNLRDFVPF